MNSTRNDEGRSEKPTQGDPKVSRSQLYQKLGWCLVRMQQIELGMKWLAIHTDFESPAGELTEQLERRSARISKQTLGSTTEAVSIGLLKPLDWEPPTSYTEETLASRIRVGMSIGLADDHAESIRGRLNDIVARRNLLVHQLIATHDIWTAEGCASATSFVEDTTDLADLVLNELNQWISDLTSLGQALASLHIQDLGPSDDSVG